VPLLRRRQPSLDTQDYTVETQYCEDCDSHFARVTGYVHEPNDGPTVATYYAVCHGHPHHEVALDVILGSWGDDADFSDHETFSCIWRPRPQGVMAVDAFVTLSFPDGEDVPATLGRPMSRQDALQSPRIKTVWAITDALATTVDPITEQVMPRRFGRRRQPGRSTTS
jgi:hypothetical protein